MKQYQPDFKLIGGRPLLFDGAMGTELFRSGIPMSACLEALVFRRPEVIGRIHREYREAGAEIISTATFGANRMRLAAHGLAHKSRAINMAAVELARDHAGDTLVAGVMGPSGLQNLLDRDQDSLHAVFRDQADALVGVDLYVLETFGDLRELRTAILAVREKSDLPVVAQLSFRADGCTLAGQSVEQVVADLSDLRIDALGANCTIGDGTIERVLARLATLTRLPLSAEPNAGEPQSHSGSLVYPVSIGEFAAQVARLQSKVALIGGCCGITPQHIAEARRVLDS